MLCGVTATLGSNPSATATAARPHWGRAVLLCLPDLWASSLGVPVGGGPPARRPRRVVMLVAPLVFRAPEGPAAREARHPHFVRRCASKPARALRTLRRPSHQWGWGADVWFGASSRSPARPRNGPRALEISRVKPLSPLLARLCVGLKPPSPLLAQAEPQLKPLSPLLARLCVGLKPPSPLLAQAEPQLKPLSPLRLRNGCFWRGFRLQR